MIVHILHRSSEGKEFLQEESIQLKKRLDKGERTAGLMAALGSVEEWLHHSEDAVNYFTEAVKMEPESKTYHHSNAYITYVFNCPINMLSWNTL